MVERADFALGSVEAAILGRALGVDVRRFPLRIRNTTIDSARLASLAKLVHLDLEERGLSRGGELIPAVESTYTLFSRHRVSVAITGIDGLGKDITVLTMTDGAHALGITQAAGEDQLQFSLFSDDELVDVLAGVLPAAEPAPGAAIAVTHRAEAPVSAMKSRRRAENLHDLDETDAFGNMEIRGDVRSGRARGRTLTDIDRLRDAMSGERWGGGHIVTTGRGKHGERRDGAPLSWLDTSDGRYLVLVEPTDRTNHGDLRAHYVPANRTQVAAAVRDAISDVY